MGFVDKMKNWVGLDDELDDDFDEEMDQFSQAEIDAYRSKIEAPLGDFPKTEESAIEYGVGNKAFTEVMPPMSSISSSPSNMKVSMNQSSQFKMVVIEPKNFDEAKKLVDNLRARKPVIVNLEKVETDIARKMFDFLNGATYALSGSVQRISMDIFLFAPKNVNIKAEMNKTTATDKPEDSNPWK